MHYVSRSMLGSLGDSWWGSFWENEPAEDGAGHLFGLVTIEGAEAGQRGRRLIDEINNQAFSGVEVADSMAANEKWVSITVWQDRVAVDGKDFEVYLVRDNRMAPLLAGKKKVGGKVNPEDRFLLISQQLQEKLGEEKIRQILAEKTVDGIAEKIQEQILAQTDQTGLAGALVEVNQESLVTESVVKTVGTKWKHRKIKWPKIRLGWLWRGGEVGNRWNLGIGVGVLILLTAGILWGYQRKKTTEKTVDMEAVAPTMAEKAVTTENLGYELIYNTELTGNEGKNYSNIVIEGDKAYITDRSSGRIDKIDWKLKSAEKVLVDEKIKGVGEVTVDNGRLLAFDGQNIWEIGKEGVKSVGEVSTNSLIKLREWNGVWYFLASDGTVWKKGEGQATTKWTGDKEELVTSANDLAIDGSVWVSNTKGALKQYQKGKKTGWKTLTVPEELDIIRVLTKAESKQVVLVSGKKIWAFDKAKGTLVDTIDLEKVGIKDASMTGDGQEVIVLGQDQKIYGVKLRSEIL